MKAKNCGNCQYYRQPSYMTSFAKAAMMRDTWCSNSKSDARLSYVAWTYSCDKFVRRGKKAPLWMRLLNKVMR